MNAFFAYASSPREIGQAINAAQALLSRSQPKLRLRLWEENDISGRPLSDAIFEHIRASEFVIADVTTLNFNVTFELAFAIGLGKRVYLVRSRLFVRTTELANRIGIFDTLGFQEYANEVELERLIASMTPEGSIPLSKRVASKAPVYLLQTPIASQAMLAIIGRVKKARLQYRGYLPQEDSRLSAVKAIDGVSEALGVVVPLLPTAYQDADIHNIRAAFVSGLAQGLGKAVLMLQPVDGPAPLDVRDIVSTFKHPDDIGELVASFALEVTEKLQEADPLPNLPGSFLSDLSIGDPTAENELQTLGSYFVRTDQFGRASRGEVNLVVGRKGAGKTALFWHLTNQKRAKVPNVVVDLKPQGYQLIRLKEDVSDFLAEGAKAHLITAFFEYVLYLEIAYKLLEKDRERHIRDGRLYAPYQRLSEVYQGNVAGEGDFSERLLSLSQRLAADFRRGKSGSPDQRLTAAEVTELVHKNSIREVRDAVSAYLEFKEETWVLFDNLGSGLTTTM